MNQLISIPFIAIIFGLLTIKNFFIEKYRKVIDAIKLEITHQIVRPALMSVVNRVIEEVRDEMEDEEDVNSFTLGLRGKLEEINFVVLEDLSQKIFGATETLRRAETIFDRYLIAEKRTIILSLVLAISTFLVPPSQSFMQTYIKEYMLLFGKIYWFVFLLLLAFWSVYFFKCLLSLCNLSKLWKNYI